MLCDDVLIENNKYGRVIMQNNGTMKIVNFTHAQMAWLKPGVLSFARECRYKANTQGCTALNHHTLAVLSTQTHDVQGTRPQSAVCISALTMLSCFCACAMLCL